MPTPGRKIAAVRRELGKLRAGFELGAWHRGWPPRRLDGGGGAEGWAGAELGPRGGLPPSRGPMIEDWRLGRLGQSC